MTIGGDDMKLILYDLRCEESENKITQINKKYFFSQICLLQKSRTHTMGISALKFADKDSNYFYSGS